MLAVFTPLSHNAQHSSGTMQPYSIMCDLNLHQVGSSSLIYCGHVEVAMMLLIGARVNVTLITLYSSGGLLNALVRGFELDIHTYMYVKYVCTYVRVAMLKEC